MKSFTFDTSSAICTRAYDVIGAESVYIYLWAPKIHNHEHSTYMCNYKITGIGMDIERYSVGIDSVAAIIYAFNSIDSHLRASQFAKDGRLSWISSQNDFGIPSLSS